ncbi:MAG: hypothetical protein D6698_09745 [Gammaproteobacteria bacterium]|nr:MAG: hypothetical protein D6698_09745 [Gammaproteobacteria bacterium]
MADPNGILYADAPGWSKDQGTFSRHVDVGAYLKISHPDGRSSIPLRPDVVVLPRTLYLVDNKKESDNYNNYEWSESTWDDFGLKISHVLKKLPVRACLLSTLQVATSMLPSTPRDATVQEKTKASEKINEAYEGTHEALSKGNFSDVLIVFDWFSENAEELAIRRALGDLFMFADTGLHSVLPSSEDFHPEIAESFFRNRYYVTGFPEGIKGFYTMLLYENGVVILDFKYDSYTGVNAEGEKPERDRRKQWAYALALQSMKLGGDGCRVRRNVYVIPGEPAEDTSDGKEDGIEILKWNIGDVMRDYGRSEYVG